MAKDPEVEAIKDSGKFDKIIQGPSTSKVMVKQIVVEIDRGIIWVTYQVGDQVGDNFIVLGQKEIMFNSSDGTEFKEIYAAMKINMAALIAIIKEKI